MEEQKETVHKRRVRYKGKYPKKFEEKYKELNPEKYQDTIAHVIQKGNTPAGMHISIMVNEIINFLNIQPGETGFDATLGYGGHTKAMLQQLQGKGHMYATDVDPIESAKTKKRLADAGFGEDILTIKLQNFCTIDEIAKEAGGFDFILADLWFLLLYKRLSNGAFNWPRSVEEALEISPEQYTMLMQGLEILPKHPIRPNDPPKRLM